MTDAFAADPVVADPVSDLVGEGKKFKSVEDLAKGKLEADNFINQLKTELDGLRKELSTKVDTEAALTELRNEFKQMKELKPAIPSKENTTPTLSVNDLKTLVAKTITEEEQRKTTAQNIVSANNAVIQHYGSVEKAQEALRVKAQELNLTIDDLKSTAARSPTAFLKLVLPEVKLEPQRDFKSGSVNTTALPNVTSGGPKEGTKEYYDQLRVKNPKQYWTPAVQNAIYKAAMSGTYDYTAGVDRG